MLDSGASVMTVCIPTRNRLDLLVPCLLSLARTCRGTSVDVVIGDTGSSAATFAAYELMGLRVVRVDGPFNFSRVCNAMAAVAGADRLLFLNSDTAALSSRWVDAIRFSSDHQVLGACLVYPRTLRIQSAGIGVVRRRGLIQRNAYRPRRPAADAPRLALQSLGLGQRADNRASAPSRVMAVSGAFLSVARDWFDQLGRFDEEYRVDLQDVDLCLRAWAQGGEVVCDPSVVFSHRHAGTRGRYAFPADDWHRLGMRWRRNLMRWEGWPPM